jgi:hypothetical protein
MTPLLGIVAYWMLAAAYTVVGWMAWTGRWRGWQRFGNVLESWWPLGPFLGGLQVVLATGFGLAYVGAELVGEDAPAGARLTAVGTVLILSMLPTGLPLILAAGNLLSIEDTYRKRPNGTRTARLLLPRWYREELQQRVATTPDRQGADRHRPPPPLWQPPAPPAGAPRR